jgi:putative transposase
LAAAAGKPNLEIAAELGVDRDTVSKWRRRWLEAGDALQAVEEDSEAAKPLREWVRQILSDAYRSGAPPKFTAEQICQIIAVACEDPHESGRPISHWTPRELAEEVVKRKIVDEISPRTVGRFLKSGRPEAAFDAVLAESPAG